MIKVPRSLLKLQTRAIYIKGTDLDKKSYKRDFGEEEQKLNYYEDLLRQQPKDSKETEQLRIEYEAVKMAI